MGLFDRFKKQKKEEPTASLGNVPEMLNAKLLFFEKPVLDADSILEEVKLNFSDVFHGGGDKALMYFFPDIKIQFADGTVPAQVSIFVPNDESPEMELPEQAFQQNWNWPEAEEVAGRCKYEILVTDFMATNLDHQTRVDLFTNFLVAAAKVSDPQAIYSIPAQKLIETKSFVEDWEGPNRETLFGIVNVRLFNIANDETRDILMDTVGMSPLGLPDFQFRFSSHDEGRVAALLLNYVQYVYDKGDIIADGNTISGFDQNEKYKCQRQVALAGPERIVINLSQA